MAKGCATLSACRARPWCPAVPVVLTQETRAATTSPFVDASWNRATVSTDSEDPLLGVTLGGTYVVERVLGEGGMGRVYLARHTRIGKKRLAVKVLHQEYAGNPEVLARFQREAEAAAAVSHPNVLTVFDVARTPAGLPYLVCEFLDGIDLSQHLKAVGTLEVSSAFPIMRQICRGLSAAHRSGVVHRDLKPQNIFLVGDFTDGVPACPEVKILDFGLSRFLESSQENQLTGTGVIMGTPSYMAPEQARAQPVDHRADIYGVGAILYTALMGRPPYLGETPHETILAVLNEEPLPPRAIESGIPEIAEAIVNRAMARDPRDRFPDARALELSLEAFESRQFVESLPPRMALLPDPARHVEQLFEAPDFEESDARVWLLYYVICAVLLLTGTAMTSVSGVELALGATFDRVETSLYLLAFIGSALTGLGFWFNRIRRGMTGGAKTLGLLREVRATQVSFILAYGLGALALQVVDGGLVRLFGSARIAPAGATWAGWNLLLPLLALVVAAGQFCIRRLTVTVRDGLRRWLAIWSVASALVMLVGCIVVLGLHWREATASNASELRSAQQPSNARR